MKKKLILVGLGIFILIFALICIFSSPAPYQLVINSKYIQTDIVVKNGLTFVPLDALKAMHLDFDWDPMNKKVVVTKPNSNKKLVLQVGSKIAMSGTKKIPIDAPVQLVHSRVVVPLRLIGEAFDAEVSWVGKIIVIRSDEYTIDHQILNYSNDLVAARKIAISLPPNEQPSLQSSAKEPKHLLIFPEGEALRYYQSWGNHIWYYEIRNDVKHLIWEATELSTGEKIEEGKRPAQESNEIFFELAKGAEVVKYGRMNKADSPRLYGKLGNDIDFIAGMVHAIPDEARIDIVERKQN